jgi:hypothetical protein
VFSNVIRGVQIYPALPPPKCHKTLLADNWGGLTESGRSKSIETLLPILCLKGISTRDFSEALEACLKDAAEF